MDGTGGLVPISALGRHDTFDGEDGSDEELKDPVSGAALLATEEGYLSDTPGNPTSNTTTGSTVPPPRRTRKRRKFHAKKWITQPINFTTLLSRPRLVFRLISMIASGATIGGHADVLLQYNNTKGQRGNDGVLVWPRVEITPTILMLVAALFVGLVETLWMVGSAKVRIRYLESTLLILLSSTTSLLGLTISIIAIAFQEIMNKQTKTHPTLFWTCQAKLQDWTSREVNIEFKPLCGELRMSLRAMYFVVISQLLIFIVSLLSFCFSGIRRPGAAGGKEKDGKWKRPRILGGWKLLK